MDEPNLYGEPNNEVVVRLPGTFETNAAAAGFIWAALNEALSKTDDIGWQPVAVVWKDHGEPWRLFTDGGAEEVDEPLVFTRG